MSAHTPGPWICEENEGFSQFRVWSKMSPSGNGVVGRKVASLAGDDSEVESNARLIAAAPELLEALRELLAVAPSTAPASGLIEGIDERHLNAIYQARAAISKSTEQNKEG